MRTTLLSLHMLVMTALLAAVGCGSNASPASPTVTSATTVTWTNLLGPNGAVTRSFITSRPGTIAVALQAAAVPLGVGIGVAPASGKGCLPSVSWTLSPGEQAPATPVDQGTYCLLVFDVGQIVTERVEFTLGLEYP